MNLFEFSPKIEAAAQRAMEKCAEPFAELDRLAELNGQKVLKAFIDNRISDIHMKGTKKFTLQ